MADVLLIDVSYVCRRAMYTTGMLKHKDSPTGTLFGFFVELEQLMDLFAPRRVGFAFDGFGSIRAELYDGYKSTRKVKRKEATAEEKKAETDFHIQVGQLRDSLLAECGFQNIWQDNGFEADDIIASHAKSCSSVGETVVIVSNDEDLWQCLDENVCCYSPAKKKTLTADMFTNTWGVHPDRWAEAKAIAGCSGDDVPGVPGVAEKTAIKFMIGKYKKEHKKYLPMMQWMSDPDGYARSLKLVQLPYEGTTLFDWKDDNYSTKKLRAVQAKLGIRAPRAKPEPKGFF